MQNDVIGKMTIDRKEVPILLGIGQANADVTGKHTIRSTTMVQIKIFMY
jgi:hypothetical protein